MIVIKTTDMFGLDNNEIVILCKAAVRGVELKTPRE